MEELERYNTSTKRTGPDQKTSALRFETKQASERTLRLMEMENGHWEDHFPLQIRSFPLPC